MVVSTIDAITELEEFLGLDMCSSYSMYGGWTCGSDGVFYEKISGEFAKAQCANKGLMKFPNNRACRKPTKDYRAGNENTVNQCRDERYEVVKDKKECEELAKNVRKYIYSVSDDKHLKFCSIQGNQIFFNNYMEGSFKSPNDAPICVKDIEFVKLKKKSRKCPDGFEKITNDIECLLATEDLLNLEFNELKVDNQRKHVSGCYFNEGDGKSFPKKVFFNPYTGGNQKNWNNHLICQKKIRSN